MSIRDSIVKSIRAILAVLLSLYLGKVFEAEYGITFHVVFWPCLVLSLYFVDYLILKFETALLPLNLRRDVCAVSSIALRAAFFEICFFAAMSGIESNAFRLNIMSEERVWLFNNKGLKIIACYPFSDYDAEEKEWNFKPNEGVVGWCFKRKENRIVDISNPAWTDRLPEVHLDSTKRNNPKVQQIKWICSKVLFHRGKQIAIITLDSSEDIISEEKKSNGDPIIHSQRFTKDIEYALQFAAETVQFKIREEMEDCINHHQK